MKICLRHQHHNQSDELIRNTRWKHTQKKFTHTKFALASPAHKIKNDKRSKIYQQICFEPTKKKIGRRENHSRSRSILTAVALFTSLNSFRFISSRFSCAIGINIVLNVIFWLFYLFLRANALSLSLSLNLSLRRPKRQIDRNFINKSHILFYQAVVCVRGVCKWENVCFFCLCRNFSHFCIDDDFRWKMMSLAIVVLELRFKTFSE